ncbi:MAG: ParA family protein, partial [Actinomycetota bacterium]|nr:ParA family protein [Actinomycetota bacterium]
MQASDPATKRATTLVFANHKGGCGKTTSTANLAVALAARGRRVLVIDADPQANLSEAFGVIAELAGPRLEDALAPPPARDVIWDAPAGVDLIPCSAQLEAVASEHADDPSFATRLRELVDALSPSYDAIVIDTPPGLGPLSSMA